MGVCCMFFFHSIIIYPLLSCDDLYIYIYVYVCICERTELVCYESKPLGLDDEVTLYRVYTRELNGELCTE